MGKETRKARGVFTATGNAKELPQQQDRGGSVFLNTSTHVNTGTHMNTHTHTHTHKLISHLHSL